MPKAKVTLDFKVNGKIITTIDVPPETGWEPSLNKTHERIYVGGKVTRKGKTGWRYGIVLERPPDYIRLEKDVKKPKPVPLEASHHKM